MSSRFAVVETDAATVVSVFRRCSMHQAASSFASGLAPGEVALAVTDDSTVIGALVGRVDDELTHEGRSWSEGFLAYMAVLRSHRGEGAGSRLLNDFLGRCRTAGSTHVSVRAAENPAVRRFYYTNDFHAAPDGLHGVMVCALG